MSTIPASQLVNVVPGVLAPGGSSLDIIGLFLTSSTRVPIGAVQSFPDSASVGDYFGDSSDEAALASIYFGGFDNSTRLPSELLFAQYNGEAVSAFLRGGDVSSLTLAELQALSGLLALTIDGVLKSASPSLAAASSFSSAAAIIAAALGITGVQEAAFTGSIAGTVLTVSAVSSGSLEVGQLVEGTGVTGSTFITALGTGTGATGTYTVGTSQTALSASMTASRPGVTYDSVSGAFIVVSDTTGDDSTITFGSGVLATSLKLTQITGAVISQGADAAVPGAFMDGIVAENDDWVTFMTTSDPDETGENTVKQAFAAWVTEQENRYCYVCIDPDEAPRTTLPAEDSMGFLLDEDENSGTVLISELEGADYGAFFCGAAASINFDERNGRITFAFKKQAGIEGDVETGDAATNLGGSPQTDNRGNGYNFYGAYANGSESFTWFQRGFVTGDFRWADAYINQVWLNSRFKSALLNLMGSARSIPYNAAGRSLIESALADPITAGLNFGAFGPGPLSASQIAQVNADAGVAIADSIQTQGYYLQILPATPEVRAARTSPPCKFWYLDNGSVQAINLASVALQ